MTWAGFYLICFMMGVLLSVVSFLGAGLRLPHLHFHLPHGHIGTPSAGGAGHAGAEAEFPFFNFASMTAFLAWFGGTGYLLTEHSTLLVVLILLIAVAAGLLGAAIVFWFVVKVLLPHDRELDPADYERVGVLGRVSSPIRAGGTGEIIFALGGTRQTCGARTERGEALARGTEVVVTRYERGIAYVRRWDEIADERKTESELTAQRNE
jgi:membrane protein implicated in regulation of membrane protease activity